MKEAFNRGYDVRIFDVCDVTFKDNDLYADSNKVHFDNSTDLKFSLQDVENIRIKELDYVINRVNPPFNKEYLYLTQLLEVSGVECINSAKSLRENNEKLIILNFPDLIPHTKVTNSLDEIRAIFSKGFEKIVLKPLDGMGGKSIFFVKMRNNYRTLLISGALIFFWAWCLVFDYYCHFWCAHSGSSFHIRTHSLSWIIIIPFPTFKAACYRSLTRKYRSSAAFYFFSPHDCLGPF